MSRRGKLLEFRLWLEPLNWQFWPIVYAPDAVYRTISIGPLRIHQYYEWVDD